MITKLPLFDVFYYHVYWFFWPFVCLYLKSFMVGLHGVWVCGHTCESVFTGGGVQQLIDVPAMVCIICKLKYGIKVLKGHHCFQQARINIIYITLIKSGLNSMPSSPEYRILKMVMPSGVYF